MNLYRSERDRENFLEYVREAVKRYAIKVKTFLSQDSNSQEILKLKILKPRPTPDDIIQAVSDEFGCGMESILRKGKKSNLARDLAMYLCRQLTGEAGIASGRRFSICGAGIAARHGRMAKKLKTDRKLKGRDDRIRRKILYV